MGCVGTCGHAVACWRNDAVTFTSSGRVTYVFAYPTQVYTRAPSRTDRRQDDGRDPPLDPPLPRPPRTLAAPPGREVIQRPYHRPRNAIHRRKRPWPRTT